MTDAIVVGGGIIGMLTARELQLAGLRVTLLERRQTGRESTWAGGGIVSPLYPWRYDDAVTRLAGWSQGRYQALSDELEQASGISPEWIRNGLLVLDTQEQQQAQRWAEGHGSLLEIIGSEQINELEPGLGDPPEQAIWLEDVAQVRNPRIASALRQTIERDGVTIREFNEVTSLRVVSGCINGVSGEDWSLEADKVILCTGAWSTALLRETGAVPEIKPVRGQMILFRARPDALKRITLFDDHYTIPRRDGRVLMGSTLEQMGFDKSTTPEARDELWQLAVSRFPLLADCTVEHHWAGLRPGSPNGIPYIGEHPDIRGLFVNSGHFRNGVVMGPASARLCADLVMGCEPILDPTPYALNERH